MIVFCRHLLWSSILLLWKKNKKKHFANEVFIFQRKFGKALFGKLDCSTATIFIQEPISPSFGRISRCSVFELYFGLNSACILIQNRRTWQKTLPQSVTKVVQVVTPDKNNVSHNFIEKSISKIFSTLIRLKHVFNESFWYLKVVQIRKLIFFYQPEIV